MPRRRPVLALGLDPDLAARLRGLLSVYGVQLDERDAAAGADAVALLGEVEPSLLVVGESGGREGLGVIARVRRARGGAVRILLLSDSLSPRQLALHAKQRYHADAVLDSGTADDEAIEALVRELKAIPKRARRRSEAPRKRSRAKASRRAPAKRRSPAAGPDPEETAARSDEPAAGTSQDWVSSLLDERASRRDEGDGPDESPAAREADAPSDDPDLERQLARRDAEVARLRQELDRSERYLQTSPFSEDFRQLREETEAREGRIRELEDALETATSRDADTEQQRDELADLLLEARERAERAEAAVRDAEDRLERRKTLMQAERDAVVAEYDERLRSERALHEQAVARAEAETRQIEERYTSELARVAEARARDLESLRRELDAEHAAEQARRERDWQRRFDDQEEARQGRLEALRHEQAAVESAQQAAQDLAMGELEERLAEERAEAAAALDAVEKRSEQALRDAAESHAAALEQLGSRQDAERARFQEILEQERALRATAEVAAREEREALEERLARERREGEEQRLREIQELAQRLELEEQQALHSVARAAQEKLDAERAEHREATEKLRARCEQDLAKLREQGASVLAAAREDHEGELESLRQLRAADLHVAEESNAAMLRNLREEHEQALVSAAAEHQRTVRALESQLEREQETSRAREQQLEDLGARATAQAAELRDRAEQERAVALEEARREAEADRLRAVSKVQADSDRRFEELSRQQGEALSSLRETHANELTRLRASHEETARSLEEKHQLELQKLGEGHDAELRLAEVNRERGQAQVQVERDQAVQALETRFETKLSRARRDLQGEREAHEATRVRAAEQVSELETSHRESLARLQALQQDSADTAALEQRLADIESQGRARLENLRQEFARRQDQMLAAAGETFERERQAMIADHDAEIVQLEKSHGEALASMDEMWRAEVRRMEQAAEDQREEHAQEMARALLRND